MDYYAYGGVCLARPQNEPLPPGALRVSEPFDPTVFLFYDLSPQAAGLIHTNGKTLLNTGLCQCLQGAGPECWPRLPGSG